MSMRATEALPHAHAGAAVAGDEAAEKLEEIRIVADDEHVLAGLRTFRRVSGNRHTSH